tara:strand:+ start:20787 stop:21551 length:765 start_codon:yes stop_codon:yes gene_type:complete
MSDPENWLESLPEALRDAPYLRPLEDGTIKPVDQVLADLQHAAKINGNSIKIPREGEDLEPLTEKVLQHFPDLVRKSEAIGAPEEYQVPEDTVAPEQLVERARKLNLTQDQFDVVMEQYTADVSATLEQQDALKQQTRDQLRDVWGLDLESKQEGVSDFLANSGAPESIVQALGDGVLDVDTVIWLHSLVGLGSEDAQMSSLRGESTQVDHLAEYDQVLTKLRGMRRGQPGYEALLVKSHRLLLHIDPKKFKDR